MTPIPFPLPAGRILPPTTAYTAGLICEHRPDLADGVRSAVLGDAAPSCSSSTSSARSSAATSAAFRSGCGAVMGPEYLTRGA